MTEPFEAPGSDPGLLVEDQLQEPRQFKVLLHNDDKNDVLFVAETILELTPLNQQEAVLRMKEAHEEGVALLLHTHKERAELYQDQFESKGLTVTIAPDER